MFDQAIGDCKNRKSFLVKLSSNAVYAIGFHLTGEDAHICPRLPFFSVEVIRRENLSDLETLAELLAGVDCFFHDRIGSDGRIGSA